MGYAHRLEFRYCPRLKGKVGNTEVIDPLRIYGEFLGQLYLNALPEEEVDDEDFWGEEGIGYTAFS